MKHTKTGKKASAVNRQRLVVKSAKAIILDRLAEDVDRTNTTLDQYVAMVADPDILMTLVGARSIMRGLLAKHPGKEEFATAAKRAQQNLDTYVGFVANPDVLESLMAARDAAKNAAGALRCVGKQHA